MAIAIVPKDYDFKKSNFRREGWLTMSEADDLICKHFGVEPDPKHYYKNWFNNFYYFDWYNVKGFYHFDSEYCFDGFETADEATLHYFKHQLHLWQDDMNLWDSVDTCKQYVQCHIEPIIKAIYDSGYRIVSLNLG
jgi:hypothetical protein